MQADLDALMKVIFDTIYPDHRDGDKALFDSGYGTGPAVINVRHLAKEIIARKAEWLK
jgi:hypothetical protein